MYSFLLLDKLSIAHKTRKRNAGMCAIHKHTLQKTINGIKNIYK